MESLYVFTLLNLLDIMTTRSALEKGGYEINPIARWFIKVMGLSGLFFLKYLVMALIVLVGHLSGNLNESIWVNNIMLSIIVGWNSYINYKLRGARR